MSFWIQHGYGKGIKIAELVDAERLSGAVLSPADEERDALARLVESLADDDVPALLDPQLYIHSVDGAVARCHETHGLEFADVRWSASARTVASHVDAVVDANRALGIDRVVAPTPFQSAFVDNWASVALQYARTTAEVAGESTYASLVIDEAAFADWSAAEEWLDEASQLEVAGFYVVVARDSSPYPNSWDPEKLSGYLRLAYRLLQNEYKMLAGYTDLEGLALAAIGADNASGWYYSQRRFNVEKWRPGGGGRAPLPRVMSDRLLVPLQLEEAQRIVRSNVADRFSGDAALRAAVIGGGWGITQSRQQYLDVMADLTSVFSEGSSQSRRVSDAIARMKAAEENLRMLGQRGFLTNAPGYLRVVESAREALQSAADQESGK